MSLRRVVALSLLVAVSTSSVEVLFGLESSLAGAETHLVAGHTGADALTAPPDVADEDCACLCACLCSGAQLVVVPGETPASPARAAVEPPTVGDLRSPTLPTPRPPHRPPMA